MVKEILISKASFDALIGAIQNLAGIFDRDLPNERNIIRTKLFEMKEIGREIIDVAKLRHPEMFGGPKYTLESVLSELKALNDEVARLSEPVTPDIALINAKLEVKVRAKIVKLTAIKERLLDEKEESPLVDNEVIKTE